MKSDILDTKKQTTKPTLSRQERCP